MKFEKIFTYIANREQRAHFVASMFNTEISASKKILDVGSDYNSLKKIVGNKVLGVDLYGEPDIVIDFEKEKLSQFKNSQFDMVVCTEVLEHLENLHEMFDELLRVSRRYVVISLPTSLSLYDKWNIVFHNRIGKYYGLPLEKPEDRHRWLFTYRDLDRFFKHHAKRKGYKIKRKFLQCSLTSSWKGQLMKAMVNLFNLNSASQSYWVLLEKKGVRS